MFERSLASIIFSVIFILAFVGQLSAPSAQAQGAAAKTVLDGVFTAAQAKRGEDNYAANCMKCHDDSAADVIPIRGGQFIDRWREQSLVPLFAFMKANMPKDAPGEFKPEFYVDVISYLLQDDGYQEGQTELTAAALPNIQLVGPDGPAPLPNGALVIAVGCLTPAAGGAFTLTNVGDLVRTRVSDETTPEEVKASQARALGNLTLQLRNIEGVVDASAHKGHKLQIKGSYNSQAAGARINVGSAEMLSATCP